MLATVANYPKSATEYLLKLGFSTQQRMITARWSSGWLGRWTVELTAPLATVSRGCAFWVKRKRRRSNDVRRRIIPFYGGGGCPSSWYSCHDCRPVRPASWHMTEWETEGMFEREPVLLSASHKKEIGSHQINWEIRTHDESRKRRVIMKIKWIKHRTVNENWETKADKRKGKRSFDCVRLGKHCGCTFCIIPQVTVDGFST